MNDERKSFRAALQGLLPAGGITLGLATPLLGGWSVIWYWGAETGFAAGRTPAAVAESVERQVYGGL